METTKQQNTRLRLRVHQLEELLHTVQYDAHHDHLTGLANRALLLDRLGVAIAMADRLHHLVGILAIDLDGFKLVNDEMGHQAGDQILQIVSTRLVMCVRVTDTVARMGGDEFVIVLPNTSGRTLAIVRDKINRSLTQPYLLNKREVVLGASIGKFIQSELPSLPEDMLAEADDDMYRTKQLRRHAKELPEMWRDIAATGLYAPAGVTPH
ncbi:GGDEF domain-containing protein [Chitinolyticbacter albus]|uniref:GGDEF domain-containing protein n=1 Tax=Chitinolyticbacter albus TaxID=2961951 RepID=UPI00210C347A|nr:GGDEF domain-containing protein [Chitinolyticbacter albus]